MHIGSYFDNEQDLHTQVVRVFVIISLLTAPGLLVMGSPYGSQGPTGGLLTIPGRVAWIIMELVSPVSFAYAYFSDSPILSEKSPQASRTLTTTLFLCLWLVHYANRSVIYPLRQQNRQRMHIVIFLLACYFNTINGYVNARAIIWNPRELDMKAIFGILVFVFGMAGNIYHDQILIGLRKSKNKSQDKDSSPEKRYSIPYGGLFRLVSCPHFLCELVEWTGFAIAVSSPAAWGFVLGALCNLIPRAQCIHNWYKKTFEQYPKSRRAIIPYVF